MLNSCFYNLFSALALIFCVNSSLAMDIKEVDTNLEVTFKPIVTKVKDKEVKTENKSTLIGRNQGIRHKKVAIFNISIYEARMFFEDSKNKMVDASDLIKSQYLAIKINPLRTFAGDKLKEAMLVSYEKNNIKPDSAAQIEFLDLVSKNKIVKNEPVYILGYAHPEKDELHLMMKGIDKIITGHKGFVKEVFSVWLGESVDKDLSNLKETLISEIKSQ